MGKATPPIRWRVPAGPRHLEVELSPWSLLRTPGFPVAALDSVARPETLVAAQSIAEAETELERLRAGFNAEVWPRARARAKAPGGAEPAPRFRDLVRAHQRVERGEVLAGRAQEALAHYASGTWVATWNAAVAARDAELAAGRATYDDGLALARKAVAAAFDDGRLQHAVHISNPGFHRTALSREPLSASLARAPTRGTRRSVATAHRYLRRFTTRCETAAFFGPVLFARLDPTRERGHTVGEPAPERLFIEPSTWMVDLLADRVTRSADPGEVRAWRSPLVRALPGGGGVERVTDGRRVRLPDPLLRFWLAADGRPVAVIGAEVGLTPDQLTECVDRLRPLLRLGAVRLPATELCPLRLLAGSDPADPGRRLAALRDDYAASPWPERAGALEAAEEVAAELGEPTRRHAGRHYADREVFHEDRSSP